MASDEPATLRNSYFWILPVEVLGSSPNTTALGTLKPARCALQCATMSSAVTWAPAFSSMKAQGVSPHFGSGLATTAAAIAVHHGQVARVEPAAGKGLLRGLRVLEVALHRDVAAEHDLAHGLAIGRHGLHGQGVHHADVALQVVVHALARVQTGALAHVQRVPGFVFHA